MFYGFFRSFRASDLLFPEPSSNCPQCPRLSDLRHMLRQSEPGWHNAPVPTFGDPLGRLLIVGLAPGVRGANRTGRPFTGDYAGDLLYETLGRFGFTQGTYAAQAQDGLALAECAITNAVRCVPPQNKPTPDEINQCRPFLAQTLSAMPRLTALVALGRIAHESVLRALGLKLKDFPFAHGAWHRLPDRNLSLFDSYHCSRYNTNTGKLTPDMFHTVFENVRGSLDAAA
ncbi:uracil-DNA glycosylase [Beijerinckia indica]|uniref:uracil-DNA glycosylase n=1 Tax=Beijerinckia indica TaxID=533 RepID=UPI0005A13B41